MPHTVRLLIVATITAIGISLWVATQDATTRTEEGYARIGGDFALESSHGPVSLHDFAGKVVAVYFGFTFCPDLCPTSLAALARAIKTLTPEQASQVQGLFISVDPERDTPQRADAYARNFDPRFIGLSGTPEQIAEVAKKFFVHYEKVEMKGSAMNYTIDHPSTIYVLNRQGAVHSLAMHGESSSELVSHLQEALEASR